MSPSGVIKSLYYCECCVECFLSSMFQDEVHRRLPEQLGPKPGRGRVAPSPPKTFQQLPTFRPPPKSFVARLVHSTFISKVQSCTDFVNFLYAIVTKWFSRPGLRTLNASDFKFKWSWSEVFNLKVPLFKVITTRGGALKPLASNNSSLLEKS